MHYPGDGGCTWHRVMLPARYCSPVFEKHGWELVPGEGLPEGHDVYVMHGLPTPQAVYELLKLKRKGKWVVWSVDDDWSTIPTWNPAFPGEMGMATYDIMRSVADFIIVSTPALARTFSDRSDTVLTAPNLLDVSVFPKLPVKEAPGGSGEYVDVQPKVPVRVVWAGGPTHTGDLEPVVDVLDHFCDKFVLPTSPGGQRAVLIFMGAAPPPKLLRKYANRGLIHQPMVPFPAYQSVLNSIDAHVYLAPLAPIPFNESKSNLRVMEGWALVAAPVASDHGEYKCVDSGHDGRLVATPDEWSSALTRLVTDHEYRIKVAVTGRMRVEEQYDWNREECRAPWLSAFSRLTGVTL